MEQGTVVRFNTAKGWGFIRPDSGGRDVMLHAKELCPGYSAAQVVHGMRVSYDVCTTERGQRAVNVRLGERETGALPEETFRAEVRAILRAAEDRLADVARRYRLVE